MEKYLCKFKGANGDKCDRQIFEFDQAEPEPYCIFHYGYSRKYKEGIFDNPDFIPAFEKIINSGDGNWRGFVFPVDICFPKVIPFAIDARGSRLNSLELDGVVFKESVDFSNSIFKDCLILKSTVFENIAKFSDCQFEGDVKFLNVKFENLVFFSSADFAGRSLLRVNFYRCANFNEAIFRDVTVFTGWRSVSLVISDSIQIDSCRSAVSCGANLITKQQTRLNFQKVLNYCYQNINQIKISSINKFNKCKDYFWCLRRKFARSDPNVEVFRVFEEESQFREVTFLKPDKVLFSQANLSKVFFQGTNLRGVRFLGVDWWQPALKRNGLYDELFIGKSSDRAFRSSHLPVLEETCRNARIALEENRSFNIASDFYIAEMEAARQQQNIIIRHLFSVTALYRFVSQYGTSVGTAIRVLVLIYLLHVVSSLYIHSPIEITSLQNQFISIALRSIKVLLLMQPETKDVIITNSQSWLDVGLRLIGPIQIAMVVIAFRTRIKRH
ncbi:pentapeptide repeat-containing protein [Nitrosomonas sp.]|uniref:pentapeptide repeat-containing protein n=1 Tax=Nitrosomonas sp. TaxID=42353 RepID=UPI00262060A2|nr:pentapeptide repeat-containing protein [Nitrosomonas sp.]MCW5601392.1 pentapeptide repeat-containing protein [Nitrosomonas sp.]